MPLLLPETPLDSFILPLPSGLATNGLHLICMGKAAPGLREPAQPEQGGTWDLHCPGDALKRVTDGCGGVNAPALSPPGWIILSRVFALLSRVPHGIPGLKTHCALPSPPSAPP